MKVEDPEFLRALANAKSRFELWSQMLKAARVQTMLEVGVWKGEYAQYILERCDSIQRYYMIDPWATLPDWNKPYNVAPKAFDEVYQEAMKRTDFAASKRIILKGRTKEVIDEIDDGSLDFAYIDGDHTLRGITIDLIKVLPKIKEGGLIGGDDFTNTPWQHGIQFEPTLVCPFTVYFAEAFDLPIAALPFEQFVIQKRSSSAFAFIDTTNSHNDISLNRLPLSLFKSALRRKVKQVFSPSRS
ncbi:MAG TPA: class I SAM-dependent methyltransferase [Lacipirellulaceae bacterium]|nr:class I SAM-dependent methyltransferase [Lacipirellulaceae bacterium]